MKLLGTFAGLVLATLGTLVLGALQIPGAPDLFLVPVAVAARTGSPVRAMLTGLAAGLIQDALTVPGRLFGLNAFAKVLLGYLLGTLSAHLIVERPLASGALVCGATLFETAVLAGLLWVLRGEPLVPAPGPLALRAISTGVLGAVVHALGQVPWRERWAARRRRRLA